MPAKPRSIVDIFNAGNKPAAAAVTGTFRATASDLVDLAVTKTRFNRNKWLIDPSTFHVMSEYFQVKQYKTFAIAKPPFAPMRAAESASNARRVSVEAYINVAMDSQELVPFRKALMSGIPDHSAPPSQSVSRMANAYEEVHRDEGKASIRVLNTLPTTASGPVVVHAANAHRFVSNDHSYYHYEVLVAGHITHTQIKKRGLAAADAWDRIQKENLAEAAAKAADTAAAAQQEDATYRLGHLSEEGKVASETAEDDREASCLTNMEGVLKSSIKNAGMFTGVVQSVMPARNKPGSDKGGGSNDADRGSDANDGEWGRSVIAAFEESTTPSDGGILHEALRPVTLRNGIRFFNLAPIFTPRQRNYRTPTIEEMNTKKVQVPLVKPEGNKMTEELPTPPVADAPAAEVAIQTHGFYGMHPVTLLRISIFNPSTSVAPSIESFVHNVTGSFVIGDPMAMGASGCSKAFGDNPYLKRLRGDKDFPRVFVHLRKVGFAVYERNWKAASGDASSSVWMSNPKWLEFACNHTIEPLMSDTQMHPKKGKLTITDGLWHPGL